MLLIYMLNVKYERHSFGLVKIHDLEMTKLKSTLKCDFNRILWLNDCNWATWK